MTATTSRAKPKLPILLLIGATSGLVASYLMSQAQRVVPPPSSSESDPATVKVADRVSRAVGAGDVPAQHRAAAGEAVHYALGAALGASYAVTAAYQPAITRGVGGPFGLGVAAVLDEGLVPALGITPPPWAYGAATHGYSAASHLVFGVCLEASRRLLLAAVPDRRLTT